MTSIKLSISSKVAWVFSLIVSSGQEPVKFCACRKSASRPCCLSWEQELPQYQEPPQPTTAVSEWLDYIFVLRSSLSFSILLVIRFCFVYRHLLQKLLKQSGTSLPWTPCTGMSFPCCPALGIACSWTGRCWHFLYHLPFCCNEVEIFAELLLRLLALNVNSVRC